MEAKFIADSIRDLNNHINSILKDNRAATKRNQRNDMRTLALLKVITGEIVEADPTAKARMHSHLDQLLLLHGDDEAFCDGIKQAVQVVDAA